MLSDDHVGKVIAGKYRVEQLIGEGGMGRVFLARQLSLDKPVVLKVLRQSLLSDERTVARFQREAKAASRLNHPNSISILDFGQSEEGALFIAMEYVPGRDLHQILTQEWPIPEGRIIRIIAQVLSALSDAHAAGVIHRDLKPENIMVDRRKNGSDMVKVLDFGIAKIQEPGGEEGPALTRTGFVCGTPEYMSPEQARGGLLDARSDLYAVGIILYQLTTGRLPFDADSAVAFATKHLSEVPPPPSRRRPDAHISPGLEALILRALAKDPNDRPQSAKQFRAELLALEQEAGDAGEDAEATVQVSPARLAAAPSEGRLRPWTRAVFAGGTLLVLGVAYAVLSLRTPVPPPAAPAPAPEVHAEPRPPGLPPYEREITPGQRDPQTAQDLAREGDRAQRKGDLAAAAEKYAAAFEKDPMPELSLKLGEIQYQRNRIPEARGWWKRHLRDRADSHARRYIEDIFSDL